jgi:hypothetical protein
LNPGAIIVADIASALLPVGSGIEVGRFAPA